MSKRRRALLFGIPIAVVPGLAGWELLATQSPPIEFPAPTMVADTLRSGLPFTASEITEAGRAALDYYLRTNNIILDDKETNETPP